ncbi:cobyrinate a,c-diamide synthase [Sneathiella sp. HT1-7]|uniref:cobyrinate a,c-diamide synthase n=1 Tax=Sneathiella sp. HT1-7 TaxID=2887192 RepID=UPI001D14C59C|nr:cobyrinate a,c-diamide synthase [Sneathiella sp. HT1-7]MCC3304478.1 cobyrinate a,c-diamide synthase [Sneathiella sp. HT1-7]
MASANAPTLIIAAPASGSGKTTITLALLRAFRRKGIDIGSFKIGPDYIDPVFHSYASGNPCLNLDPWAMRPESQNTILEHVRRNKDLVIGEGVMGLFDGARDGTGSTADVAADWQIPIILVVDAKGQGASVMALLQGFENHREDTSLAGVIFNKVGGPGHVDLLKSAAADAGIPALGFIPKSESLTLNHRHLGLVQAREKPDLEVFLETAADIVETNCDLIFLRKIAKPNAPMKETPNSFIPPLAQRIAIAEDDAFAFTYPHILAGWQQSGAEITFFSPLADEAPDQTSDAVFLPGGYPELYGDTLAASETFKAGVRAIASKNKPVYGECGGFMVLGEELTDRQGAGHKMLGLLPIETTFAEPKLYLGYRNARLTSKCILGNSNDALAAHEFHYATLTKSGEVPPLFNISDATGKDLGSAGAVVGSVAGSFIHLIDRR